jgi:hypothetical protein
MEAPIELSIRVKGHKELIGFLDRYSKTAIDECMKVMSSTADRIQQGAISKAPVSSGALLSGIDKFIGEPQEKSGVFSGKGIYAVVKARTRHSIYMEYGTSTRGAMLNVQERPSWHQYKSNPKFVSPRGVAAWARLHGIKPFVLARALTRQGGVAPQPFLFPSWKTSQDVSWDRQ